MLSQLSGIDATFLYMETPTSFGHVSGMSIFERPNADFNPYEAFRTQVESRLAILEPFRRRLVEVPFGLNRPYWLEDPDFDLDYHVRHIAIPSPGDPKQLANQVARLIGRPMDRTRPLWEAYVLEGLEGGDFAVLTKVHHATIDGAAGVELLSMLLESSPEAVPVEFQGGALPTPGRMPSPLETLAWGLADLGRHPERIVRMQIRAARGIARMTRSKELSALVDMVAGSLPKRGVKRGAATEPDQPSVLPLTSAPATPFNRSITAHRRFAFRSVPLDDIKAVKTALGATVNDVVMAIAAGALRRYLQGHHALPDAPLVSMVPMSIRTGEEEDRWTNRVSSLFCAIPTHLEDPIERVHHVHQSMVGAKKSFDLLPAEALMELSQFAPPALAHRAARLAVRLRMGDRMNQPVNLVISNVPGARQPLYLAGALLKHYYPVSTIVEGQGLNITVQSYLDRLDFGLVSCRELVPDLWELLDLCVDELDVLCRAAGVTRVVEQPKPSTKPRRAARPTARPAARPAKRAASARSPRSTR